MFKVLLLRRIYIEDGVSQFCDGCVRAVVDLPFAPFVGLTIDDGPLSADVEEIVYDIPQARFVGFCASDIPDYAEPPHKRTREEIEECIADSVSLGWERCADGGRDYDDAAAAIFDREWAAREWRLAGK